MYSHAMQQKLTPSTMALLTAAPLMWAGNAVVGRLVHELVSPMLLNFVRWLLAFAIMLPLAYPLLRRGSPLWPQWKRWSIIGLLGIGCYNAFQYMALKTSGPINVTLVASSMPLWMMAFGTLFFQTRITRPQMLGALFSVSGVLLVLSHGSWQQLTQLRLVPGDLFMLLSTACWSLYSWLLVRTPDPAGIKSQWALLLMAQLTFGLLWSGLFAAGEWAVGASQLQINSTLLWAIAYIVIGPALVAYRCWGVGVQRVGPTVAGFFTNLTPLFAAVLSAAFLGEPPRLYHAAAFVLVVAGIVISSRRA